MKWILLISVLSVCGTAIYVARVAERMQARRTVAAVQVAMWRAGR